MNYWLSYNCKHASCNEVTTLSELKRQYAEISGMQDTEQFHINSSRYTNSCYKQTEKHHKTFPDIATLKNGGESRDAKQCSETWHFQAASLN